MWRLKTVFLFLYTGSKAGRQTAVVKLLIIFTVRLLKELLRRAQQRPVLGTTPSLCVLCLWDRNHYRDQLMTSTHHTSAGTLDCVL